MTDAYNSTNEEDYIKSRWGQLLKMTLTNQQNKFTLCGEGDSLKDAFGYGAAESIEQATSLKEKLKIAVETTLKPHIAVITEKSTGVVRGFLSVNDLQGAQKEAVFTKLQQPGQTEVIASAADRVDFSSGPVKVVSTLCAKTPANLPAGGEKRYSGMGKLLLDFTLLWFLREYKQPVTWIVSMARHNLVVKNRNHNVTFHLARAGLVNYYSRFGFVPVQTEQQVVMNTKGKYELAPTNYVSGPAGPVVKRDSITGAMSAYNVMSPEGAVHYLPPKAVYSLIKEGKGNPPYGKQFAEPNDKLLEAWNPFMGEELLIAPLVSRV